MSFVLDLYPRYQRAFGFVPVLATPDLQRVGFGGNKFSGASVYVKSGYCFADMELASQDFKIRLGDPNFFLNNSGSGLFVGPPMISASRSKNIKVTSPDRSEGEVVENFGKKSWEIKIKGVIVDMAEHKYPGNQVKQLRQLFDIDDVLDVTCDFLRDLGIYSVYITEFDEITGVEGYEDTLSYSFTLRSTQPVEFAVIKR